MAGGLVYSPPQPPSLWTPNERKATAIPYAILLAVMSWGRFPGESLGVPEPSEPHGWWGEAYLPTEERPWGCEVWAYFGETVTDDLPPLMAAAVAKALQPLQVSRLLGDVQVLGSRLDQGVSLVIGFERPETGGERWAELWEAYLETQHG